MAEPETPAPPTKPIKPVDRKPDPQPGQDKKPERKLDPTVMTALIGAIVTITAAVLSSPVLVTVIARLSAPTPTAIALVLPTSTLPPADTITPLPAATSVAPAEMVLLPTSVSVPTPTAEQTGSSFNCIATNTWTPYPTNLNPTASNGCWELLDWGFSTPQGQLIIAHSPTQDQQRGIYMPIPGDVDIHFTIQIDQFRVRSFKTALLTFGVVQREPFSIFSGGFLSYSQSQPGASNIQVLVSGSNLATQRLPALEFGVKQEVTLSVRGALLTVYLDGKPAGEAMSLTANERALWIGYVLPANGKLQAAIRDFSVQPQ